MNTIILILVIAAVVSLGFLAIFAMLLIGMRTESGHLSPSSAPHTRMESAARRILGLYVRRELEKTSVQYAERR